MVKNRGFDPLSRTDFFQNCLEEIESDISDQCSLVVERDADRQRGAIASAVGDRAVIAPPSFWNLRAATVGMMGARRARARDFDRLKEVVPSYLRPPDIRPNPYPISKG